jgi:hypothetical protein
VVFKKKMKMGSKVVYGCLKVGKQLQSKASHTFPKRMPESIMQNAYL